jgi:hypothetical protein
MVTTVLAYVVQGEVISGVVIYAAYVAVAFFIERVLVLKSPLSTLKKERGRVQESSSGLHLRRPARRSHRREERGARRQVVVDRQVADSTRRVFRSVRRIPGYTVRRRQQGGLQAGRGATAGENRNDCQPFMADHGALLDEALAGIGDFCATTLPALAQFGQAHWRKVRAASQLPQLEGARTRRRSHREAVGRHYVPTSVRDGVRSIDMFKCAIRRRPGCFCVVVLGVGTDTL